MDIEYVLTTTDNPYDPVTQFDRWLNYDNEKGYNTCGYLARIARTSSEFSEEDNASIIAKAIDEICTQNILGLVTNGTIAYKKIAVNTQGAT